MRLTKQTDKELRKEIEEFRQEIDRIMRIAKDMPGWNFEFSPFLFIDWRKNDKNRQSNSKCEM